MGKIFAYYFKKPKKPRNLWLCFLLGFFVLVFFGVFATKAEAYTYWFTEGKRCGNNWKSAEPGMSPPVGVYDPSVFPELQGGAPMASMVERLVNAGYEIILATGYSTGDIIVYRRDFLDQVAPGGDFNYSFVLGFEADYYFESGEYEIGILKDDGASVVVDNQVVINAVGELDSGSGPIRSGTISFSSPGSRLVDVRVYNGNDVAMGGNPCSYGLNYCCGTTIVLGIKKISGDCGPCIPSYCAVVAEATPSEQQFAEDWAPPEEPVSMFGPEKLLASITDMPQQFFSFVDIVVNSIIGLINKINIF